MTISILVPHWKTGKMTAYAISQLLKYKGSHDIEIFVINNNAGDGSEEYFAPFMNQIRYFEYPKDRLQSHGISFDWVMPHVSTDYFITIESDSFPTKENWLDYYEELINEGYDAGGSLMKLSGGFYMHPCGAFYKKSVWQEAKIYCNDVQYAYFPNMSNKNNFDNHLMVHKLIVEDFLKSPADYVELPKSYIGLDRTGIVGRMMYYSPTVAPFHNGMGMADDLFLTYGNRNIETEVPQILLDNKKKLINRIGYEPGQWFFYWMMAMGKKIAVVPTETKWLPNRVDQQQEYTLMENGLTHLWGGSAYYKCTDDSVQDIVKSKADTINELYNSLPENQKIK